MLWSAIVSFNWTPRSCNDGPRSFVVGPGNGGAFRLVDLAVSRSTNSELIYRYIRAVRSEGYRRVEKSGRAAASIDYRLSMRGFAVKIARNSMARDRVRGLLYTSPMRVQIFLTKVIIFERRMEYWRKEAATSKTTRDTEEKSSDRQIDRRLV